MFLLAHNTPMHLQVFTPLYTQARTSRGGDLHSANQINKQKQKENPELKKECHEPKLVFCLLFKDQITVFAFQELLLLEGMLLS